jgi:hypothetical protein
VMGVFNRALNLSRGVPRAVELPVRNIKSVAKCLITARFLLWQFETTHHQPSVHHAHYFWPSSALFANDCAGVIACECDIGLRVKYVIV